MLVLIIVLGNLLTHWFVDRLNFTLSPSTEPTVHRILMTAMVAYAVLMAIPFVPGVEIGVAVLMILGPKISGLVYLCTLAALILSFMIGRFIPERALINLMRDLHCHRVSGLLLELKGLESPQERLRLLTRRSPRKLVPFLLRYRHIALIAAINLPGNIVLGGGGGIALIAGLSRIFSPASFVLTAAVAIAPVPLFWYLFGDSVSGLPF